jgi:hypothetical protein
MRTSATPKGKNKTLTGREPRKAFVPDLRAEGEA